MSNQGNPIEPSGADPRPTIGLTDEGFPIKDPQVLQEQEKRRAEAAGREEQPVGKEHLDAGASGALRTSTEEDDRQRKEEAKTSQGDPHPATPGTREPRVSSNSNPLGQPLGDSPPQTGIGSDGNPNDQATDSTPFVDPDAPKVDDGTTKIPTEQQPPLAGNTGTEQDAQPKEAEREPTALRGGDLKKL
jgi:hypothetical protein